MIQRNERYLAIWEALKPKITNEIKGNLFLYGIGGELDKNKDWEDFWKNPDSHDNK